MTAQVISVLPWNATSQERALEAATARVSDVPVLVREQWSPATCPAAQLPWLAWAMSVDTWNADWTDEQKRAAIQASFEVHQRKGTAGAVKLALQALGFGTQVLEWFEQSPAGAPYTFEVEVEFTNSSLSMAALDEAETIALRTKNVRSHLTLVRGIARTDGDVIFAAATVGGESADVQPYQLTEVEGSGVYYLGAAAVSFEFVDLLPEAA